MRAHPGALALLTLAAAACSSSGGGSSASTSSQFVQQFCALLAPCCADAGLPSNGQQCTSLLDALTSQASYDAAAGQACLGALQQASSQPGFCSGTMNEPACQQVFGGGAAGTARPGQACKSDSDCAPAPGGGATCFFTGTADGGTAQACVQTLPGQPGSGPCLGDKTASGASYSWGGTTPLPPQAYVCDPGTGVTCNTTTRKCTALAPTGAPCMTDSDCVAADHCDYSGSGSPACAARLATGASCAASSDACASGDYCDMTTQTCAPGLADGAACTSSQPCASGICVNGKCGASGSAGLALFCGG